MSKRLLEANCMILCIRIRKHNEQARINTHTPMPIAHAHVSCPWYHIAHIGDLSLCWLARWSYSTYNLFDFMLLYEFTVHWLFHVPVRRTTTQIFGSDFRFVPQHRLRYTAIQRSYVHLVTKLNVENDRTNEWTNLSRTRMWTHNYFSIRLSMLKWSVSYMRSTTTMDSVHKWMCVCAVCASNTFTLQMLGIRNIQQANWIIYAWHL